MLRFWISSWRISSKLGVLWFNLLLNKAQNVWDFILIVHKPLYDPLKRQLGIGYLGAKPMSYVIDQEQTEIRSLKDAVDWVEKEVLEIGCGDGRLARRIADLYASVTAIDPHADLVKAAAKNPVKPDQRTFRYCVSDGRRLPFASEAFDIVVFGWSL